MCKTFDGIDHDLRLAIDAHDDPDAAAEVEGSPDWHLDRGAYKTACYDQQGDAGLLA